MDNSKMLELIKNEGVFKWSTREHHPDNNYTMNEFLSMLDDEEIEIYYVDGTYSELRISGNYYSVDASGDGDSFNHMVEFKLI